MAVAVSVLADGDDDAQVRHDGVVEPRALAREQPADVGARSLRETQRHKRKAGVHVSFEKFECPSTKKSGSGLSRGPW